MSPNQEGCQDCAGRSAPGIVDSKNCHWSIYVRRSPDALSRASANSLGLRARAGLFQRLRESLLITYGRFCDRKTTGRPSCGSKRNATAEPPEPMTGNLPGYAYGTSECRQSQVHVSFDDSAMRPSEQYDSGRNQNNQVLVVSLRIWPPARSSRTGRSRRQNRTLRLITPGRSPDAPAAIG